MPQLQVNLPYRNADEFAILNNAHLAQDCFFVDIGNSIYAQHKRFGLSKKFDTLSSAGGDGSFWWNEQKCYIVCSAGNVYKYTDKFGSMTKIGTNVLELNTKVIFTKIADVNNGTNIALIMANGGNMVYCDGNTCTKITGPNIPTRVSHVAAVYTHLCCNDLDNPTIWKHSDAGTPKDFSSNYSYSSQLITDNINGLYENKGMVWITGEDSIQAFYYTGNDIPFEAITQSVSEHGLVNPYAIAKVGSDVIFFDTNRDIRLMPNGSATSTVISDSYANRIQTLSSTNDVEVEYIGGVGGRKFVLFNFNDAQVTIVYDYNLKCFYEWGYWEDKKSKYKQFRGRCYSYCSEWNLHLMLDRKNGFVYEVGEEFTNDNNIPIRTEIITGKYSSNPSSNNNNISKLFFNVRRGDGKTNDTKEAPKFYVEYRINNNKTWIRIGDGISLGKNGDYLIQPAINIGGTFNCIQFRILHMDNSKFVINGIYIE